ncbi:type II toxin-antitoxin system RelE family toxin [Acaryochloris marina NIES-2412]|uniref:type II toxin-antitoxin system RelE family toxin n=1 Tax=Acaryochloris marina TaxID=155978 RepID=UPI004059B2C2
MSEWSYVVQKPAVRYLKRISRENQQRIVDALDGLIADPTNADVKPLKGRPELRLRVGSYRVLFRVDKDNKRFVITQIGPRGDIYK